MGLFNLKRSFALKFSGGRERIHHGSSLLGEKEKKGKGRFYLKSTDRKRKEGEEKRDPDPFLSQRGSRWDSLRTREARSCDARGKE